MNILDELKSKIANGFYSIAYKLDNRFSPPIHGELEIIDKHYEIVQVCGSIVNQRLINLYSEEEQKEWLLHIMLLELEKHLAIIEATMHNGDKYLHGVIAIAERIK